ncbi:hypothetical protein [Nocardioides aquaticus]|nr:hypothetical protein [Nocardioides aquaticus]
MGSLIASVAALFKVGQAAQQTSDLANGTMDQKIEDGVHRAMDDRES